MFLLAYSLIRCLSHSLSFSLSHPYSEALGLRRGQNSWALLINWQGKHVFLLCRWRRRCLVALFITLFEYEYPGIKGDEGSMHEFNFLLLYLSFFSLTVTKDTLSSISFGVYFIFVKYVSYISSNFQHCSFARMSRRLAPYHFLAMYFRYMAILWCQRRTRFATSTWNPSTACRHKNYVAQKWQ